MSQIKTILTGTFGASGQSTSIPVHGSCSVLITDGVATTTIERSYDSGTSWYPASKDADGNAAAYTTASDTAFNGYIDEPFYGVLYRLNCVWTSGTVTYRLASAK